MGMRPDVSETEIKLRHDLHYVRNLSPALDIKIIFLTIMIFMNNRYVR